MLHRLVCVAVLSVAATAQSSSLPQITQNRHEALAIGKPSLGQHDGHTPNTGVPIGLTLAVDGGTSPSSITDERAYDHLISAVATAQSERIQAAMLAGARLSSADRSAFVAAVSPLRSEWELLRDRRKAGRLDGIEFAGQQRTVFDNARGRVRTSLSTAGLTQLDEYVRTHVKSQIKIYRGPMPTIQKEVLR